MVEDHIVQTKKRSTDRMVADMGTKSLPEGQFTLYRDVMNGYALVKAAYPEKEAVSFGVQWGCVKCHSGVSKHASDGQGDGSVPVGGPAVISQKRVPVWDDGGEASVYLRICCG